MKAVIEIKETSQDWRPPFKKNTKAEEITVQENTEFDPLKDKGHLFKVHRIAGDKVLVEYNRAYTVKGYEQPQNRSVWIGLNESKSFSALWNDNGTTKTLTVKAINA
ncbi:MAG: hypothetical protein HY393_03915 [Candidatus Diapherotrites archaeon]|nr:hypothetical protein [Candidatus Diapherotrites archaeon]